MGMPCFYLHLNVGYIHIFADGESLILYNWPLKNFYWRKPMIKE